MRDVSHACMFHRICNFPLINRLEKQRQTMARLDSQYATLAQRGDQAGLAAREKEIGATFSAIAVAYADIHNTAGRMAAVGAIQSAVP